MEWIKELLTLFWDYIKFWVVVNHYEEAAVLRKGKFLKILKPGFYWKWPFIDYYVDALVKPDTKEFDPISITTADGKTISIGLMIEFEIVDSKLFLVEHNDSASNMRDLARGEMSDYIEEVNWVDIKKKTTKNALKRLLSEKYKEMGVNLIDLKFTHKAETKSLRLFFDKFDKEK